MKSVVIIFALFYAFLNCGALSKEIGKVRAGYSIDEMYISRNNNDRSGRSIYNSIMPSRYEEEKLTFERLKKIAFKRKPVVVNPRKLYYYYNPVEALRFEYQSLVPQTNDYTPILYNPALWRANHGYGFNEWGGHGIL